MNDSILGNKTERLSYNNNILAKKNHVEFV